MQKSWKTGAAIAALGVTLSAGVFIGQAIADQPRMRSALDELIAAKHDLEDAERNKGGHRARALEYTNDAIDEVREGIDHAD